MEILHYKGGISMQDNILLRSFMFLPAYNERFIEKAVAGNADAIILDMEDSVPKNKRAEAREIIKECHKKGMFSDKKTFIRINTSDSEDFVWDLSTLCLEDIDGFMPSKIESADDIKFLNKLLSFLEIQKGFRNEKFLLAPLIETTKALENVNEIAKSSERLVALCLGGEDYLNDLGSVYTYQETALVIPRAMVVNAARANGLLPIDTPYLRIADIEGLEEHSILSYRNGFAGALLVNPKQIDVVNKSYMPDEKKYEVSRAILEACEDAEKRGESIVMYDGAMVGPPMRKRAEAVVRQIKLIEENGK